jgi:hypothetical protein
MTAKCRHGQRLAPASRGYWLAGGVVPGEDEPGVVVSGVGAGAGAVELGAGAVVAGPLGGALPSSLFEHAASRLIEASIAIRARCVRVFSIISSLVQRRVILLR